MPALPRTSVGHEVMSSPWNRIDAGGDLVGGVAEQHVGQGRLARAVGAHDGVDLARARRSGRCPAGWAGPRPTRGGPRSGGGAAGSPSAVGVGFGFGLTASIVALSGISPTAVGGIVPSRSASAGSRGAELGQFPFPADQPVRYRHGRPLELRRPGHPARRRAAGAVTLVDESTFAISGGAGRHRRRGRPGPLLPGHPDPVPVRGPAERGPGRAAGRGHRRPVQRHLRRPRPAGPGPGRLHPHGVPAAATWARACARSWSCATSATRPPSARWRCWSTPTSPTCSPSRRAGSAPTPDGVGHRVSRGRPAAVGPAPARRRSVALDLHLPPRSRWPGASRSAPPGADRVAPGLITFEVVVPARGEWSTCVEVGPVIDGPAVRPEVPLRRAGRAGRRPSERLAEWRRQVPQVETDHPGLKQVVARSAEDLGALRIFDPDYPERVVVAAGAPWFMTVFGRDSLLTAWMALLVDPDLARGVLQTLARFQGTEVDPRHEEEPGRILHEMRFGDAASLSLGRREHLLRHGRRHAAVRHAARRDAALGRGPRAGRRAAAQRGTGHRVDRALRRRRRRRLRRVPPGHRPGPGQPGLEGQLGRHPLRRRPGGRGPHRPGRGAGLHLRRLPGQRPLRLRGGRHGHLRPLPVQGRPPQGQLQPGLLAGGARAGSPSDSTPTSGRSTR